MMARLLTDEAAAPTPIAPGPEGMCEASKTQHHVPARKLSFKTRQASTRGNFRSTKVSLTSSNVALIASKFNTIVIDDGEQGRALLRKLSGNQRRPSSSKDVKTRPTVTAKGEGVVKAAIEIFEHQEADKAKNGKPPIKTKLFLVRKSSSKSSVKLDDLPKTELSKKLEVLSQESAKDINSIEKESTKMKSATNIDVKEIKRKPSLKAKPVRHSPVAKQEPENSLNQRIAIFNSFDSSTNNTGKAVPNQDVKKPNFSLNERIAQFNKSEYVKPLDDKKNNVVKTNVTTEIDKKSIIYFEEKENKQEITRSILRNTITKQSSLIEQTKDRLATIVHQNNNTNQQYRSNSKINMDKKQSLFKDKFIVGEKRELKVFQGMPDIVQSAEVKDEEVSNRLSVPKNASILENVFRDKSYEARTSSQNDSVNTLKLSESTEIYFTEHQNEPKVLSQLDGNEPKPEICTTDYSESRKLNKVLTLSKDSYSTLKPSIKPYSSESPKLEKKNQCLPPVLAPDPSECIQLDKIKPNNSFLWKPASRISVVTEVPIYDDRPVQHSNDNDTVNITMPQNKQNIENDSKTVSPLDLDVASSFILEMTEQIERRFSSGSVQEKDLDSNHFRTSLEEVNENTTLKNSSFLYTKSSYDDVFTSSSDAKQVSNSGLITSNKPDVVRTVKVPPPVKKKPTKMSGEDSPPQLPEKRPKVSGEFNEHLILNPPPIPPSHTKPKLTYTLSEERWLNNCKKILEIPPPIRASDSSLSQSRRTAATLDQRSQSEKRFSVSQVELLRRMSEMNLNNKRNSLPADTFSLSSSYVDNEEEDHYTTIQPFEKNETDDQDNYEAIGENNYAEINEFQESVDCEGEGNNIYDDVVGQEQEDHYEAINCALVQADSDSSCDQSNSLYGLTRPASITAPGSVYQVTTGSESSDEWVDLDNSDDQHESVFIFREKERRGLVATESWSMKVRRQWSRQASVGDVRVSSQSILYLLNANDQCVNNIGTTTQTVTKGLVSVRTFVCLCNTYEAQEVIIYLGNEDGSDDSVPRSYENIENADETSYCDDFDDSFSDSSFDNETINHHVQVAEVEKRPQPLTEGIYGLMKQAGQQMRKHWSLGKSLTRIRMNKSSTGVQSTANLGRRGWSFKRKEKLSTAQSTFYLHSTNTLTRTDSQPETKVDPRRLSTASMVTRPTSPPPPPPPPRNSIDASSRKKSDLNSSNSSAGDNEGYIEGQRRLSRNGNSMWYIETSTTDTASEHGSSQGSDLNLRFADEPLYQFYAANIAEMTLSELTEGDTDGYEEITPTLPSALDLVSTTHHRSLWCEVPQVRNSGVLETLIQTHKKLQEAKFEVMTSEASYFKSLTVLDKLFASCPLFTDENILAREDRKVIFGNVNTVRKCSEKLLAALQACWQDNIMLQGICELVYEHVKTYQEVYVKYCTNQITMDRTLKMLKQTNSNFSTVLTQLETDPECQSLTLYSFLMLPMQRITRLRLLFDTMLSLLDVGDTEFTACQRTLDALNKCVAECNEGARSQERHEEMVKLSKQLEFPVEQMSIPILSQGNNRWLVRSGQVTQVNMDAKQTFGRRLSRSGPKFILFLFTDLFLITKKKSEDSYLVVDHCQRSLVETREMRDFPGNNRFLLQLTMLENCDSKTVEMTVSCDNETERQRWLQVMIPPQSEEPGETLYEGWDCPQVTTIHIYQPSQPDELALALGDIINVLRKSEGWFFGERTRDGEKGWFPGNYTREIASKHVRARNLKQRHRLLQLSADFVQQQRKIKS